jgi:hypothetical protein
MSMPGQRGMRRDGQLDRCELRLPGGIVRVRFAVPGLSSLQQDFAVAAGYVLRPVLSEHSRQRCCAENGSYSQDAVFQNHIGRLHGRQAVMRLLADLDTSMSAE